MLNFRKLKQDFSQSILKQGRALFDDDAVLSAKVAYLKADAVRLSGSVRGKHDNAYECEIEIDRAESEMIDSNCDCPYTYDCQHIAGLLFHLEKHLDKMIVDYSQEVNLEECQQLDEDEREQVRETIREAECKEVARTGVLYHRELLEEYVGASVTLGKSPFFIPEEELTVDEAELAVIFSNHSQRVFDYHNSPEIQLALRLPYRSKPLNILNIQEFLEAIRYKEPLYLSGRRYFLTLESFGDDSRRVLKMILDNARIPEGKDDSNPRIAQIEPEAFGTILAYAYDLATLLAKGRPFHPEENDDDTLTMPCFYNGGLEQPLCYSNKPAELSFELEVLQSPSPKILITPTVLTADGSGIVPEDVCLFQCAKPGMIYENRYYRFIPLVKRKHLRHLLSLRDVTVPEPLFGTFVENALPQLMRFGRVINRDAIDEFVTLPFVGDLEATCDISYLNGELEASILFQYDKARVPAARVKLEFDHISPFVTEEGILARNLTEEQRIIDDLFQDFVYDADQGVFSAKTEKKIVEFMTEVIPRNQHRVQFHCPENLLEQFIYDNTTFTLNLRESKRVDCYEAKLKVKGHLHGVSVDQLWECITSKRAFIELQDKTKRQTSGRKKRGAGPIHRILVLDLEALAPVVQVFDELGLTKLEDHTEERPLWSLVSVEKEQFEGLPIRFSMSKKLEAVKQQMLGKKSFKSSAVPKVVKAKLRNYQKEGVHWLERLRTMHLNGILADDMGLGKTLQAIIAITQDAATNGDSTSLVVCPTSLVYNWQEEFLKFNPLLSTLVVDGTPAQRKKLLKNLSDYDVVITSYSLLQKDIEIYQKHRLSYAILDEAQHIKNRGTRNARSVKLLDASHRLILTGTPIENSLDELWSLFDFLMPGLLSSYERFCEKFIRNPQGGVEQAMERLRNKVSPFILRRMKRDVLKELPPVSEILYHCHLSPVQKDLYTSYAESAREELSRLVKKEGFDKVQIHVLATLTRLKQICCHPGIFAKEEVAPGDSAKYDMLMELLQTLIEGNHKTVIFSQYTRMLGIMRRGLEAQGVKFAYLDGSSKNRLDIVKQFNGDASIPVFLVSLKAGGAGLNLTGADTVIHYDMWWNPAVENQATDRVHRIGQTRSVSSYKLVTKGTIEEKILELQNRKKGLVKQIVSCDDEAMSKLTWEEVLELLQT
ncbi:Uncharacterized protein SCG7086_AV_00130 [Chlamydiales bacterium SCGC AG-110-P3]|nr:Uncharacterized protein SCG7086_AV_00130 [Chlamydiales bacterium SCGC AG-110-P3]